MINATLQCRVRQLLHEPAADGRVQAMAFSRHYDATPARALFGGMRDEVLPFARVLHRNGHRSALLRLDAFRLIHPRCRPSAGVLEFFAQWFSLAWCADGAWHFHDMKLQPCFLENSKASAMLAAVDAVQPGFCNDAVAELCARI
eukprot:10584492-Lingulodinium_polyedra.AAC.1